MASGSLELSGNLHRSIKSRAPQKGSERAGSKTKQNSPRTTGRTIVTKEIKKIKNNTHLSLSEEEYLIELRGWGEE